MSRQFLVPIVLPADPAAAMEAATKQYVDARQPVADAEPSSPQTGDLWWESDSGRLFVRYDNFWVEVAQPGFQASAPPAASAVSFTPTGTVGSTDVQAAIAEVASEAAANLTTAINGLTLPMVKVRRVTPQSFPDYDANPTFSVIIFDTEDADASNMHSGGSITIPATGLWEANVVVTVAGMDADHYIYFRLTLGGYLIPEAGDGALIPVSENTTAGRTETFYATAGQVVQLQGGYVNAGGTLGNTCTATARLWMRQVMV